MGEFKGTGEKMRVLEERNGTLLEENAKLGKLVLGLRKEVQEGGAREREVVGEKKLVEGNWEKVKAEN